MSDAVVETEVETTSRKVRAPKTPSVKQIIRYISIESRPDGGSQAVDAIDAYVGSWIDLGYKLVSTHYIGQNPNGIGIIYILARQ